LRTSTFRIAGVYLALFGGSGMALLALVFWATQSFVARQTDATINVEITGLAEHYRQTGLGGLRDVIAARSRNQRQSLYILADGLFRPISGNLDQWPAPFAPDAGGWFDFVFDRPGLPEGDHAARARHLTLPGGFQLLVGRDVQDRQDILAGLRAALGWAGFAVVAIGLVGGLAMSRTTLRRVDAITRTSQDIMAGDWSRRLPVRGTGDELDRLAEGVNTMLDQIERLVDGLRGVSDNIAHDLRTPLTRLRSRLEAALAAASNEQKKTLETSIADADHLLTLFTALLDIARAESGVLRRDMMTLDLSQVCRDVVDLYAPSAEDRGTLLTTALAPGVMLLGHRALLAQALANLVVNAVKFSPPGQTIALSLEATDAEVILTVADRGPGIPAADRERAVERFVRLDSSRGAPGTGLGLSLVKAVANLHRGRLVLADNQPGLRAILRIPRVGPGTR
jgi:signal transduction histidine kinase